MTELRRDDPVDLDMPVFPHLYIEYVVGQTIEHYVEQSCVKSPTRTSSRRMFSDIAVDIRIAFSIGIQRSRHEPMFTRRQILRLRNVVVEKCNKVTYGSERLTPSRQMTLSSSGPCDRPSPLLLRRNDCGRRHAASAFVGSRRNDCGCRHA